jgi:hypothetical protein
MTKEQINNLLDYYEKTLKNEGHVAFSDADEDIINKIINAKYAFVIYRDYTASYILYLIEKAKKFEEVDKLNRWLGFIQGLFSSWGKFSICEMKEHNRRGAENVSL